MMQALFKHPLSRTIFIFTLIFIFIGLFAFVLAPLLIPIILSFALYALLEPISEIFERYGLSRNMSSLTVLLLLVGIGGLTVSLILPQLTIQLSTLQAKFPIVWQSITQLGQDFSLFISNSLGLDIKSNKLTETFFNQANTTGKTMLIEGSNMLVSLSFLIVLVPIITFFLIRDFRKFRNSLLDKLPNSSFEMGWLIYSRVAHQLEEYIRGILIQSGIMSVITCIGFYIIGIDSPVLLGVVAGTLNLIPYVGPLLAMILPILLALGQTPIDPWLIGAAISVILISQVIDNVIVIPAVIANAVNLHPLVVIVGIIIFGNLFGFIGMVIAIPLISTANIIFTGLYVGIKTKYDVKIQHEKGAC